MEASFTVFFFIIRCRTPMASARKQCQSAIIVAPASKLVLKLRSNVSARRSRRAPCRGARHRIQGNRWLRRVRLRKAGQTLRWCRCLAVFWFPLADVRSEGAPAVWRGSISHSASRAVTVTGLGLMAIPSPRRTGEGPRPHRFRLSPPGGASVHQQTPKAGRPLCDEPAHSDPWGGRRFRFNLMHAGHQW